MSELVRTGVSIEADLLEEFDKVIARRGYGNRSEALRDLIRDMLVSEQINDNRPVVATVSMIYDHEKPELSRKLTATQHHHHHNVLAATHVHLDEKNCFEVVIMRGPAGEVKHLAEHMLSMRGVNHGKLVMSSVTKSSK